MVETGNMSLCLFSVCFCVCFESVEPVIHDQKYGLRTSASATALANQSRANNCYSTYFVSLRLTLLGARFFAKR